MLTVYDPGVETTFLTQMVQILQLRNQDEHSIINVTNTCGNE